MFEGSIVAIVTPWENDALDRDALAKLVEFQIEGGTSAIVPCGTTGESATMTHDEHHEVIAFTIEQVRGRVPVIAGTGSNATAEAIDLTAKAKELGADAALLISPYYNKPSQEGIYQHYRAIAEAVDIPLIVYNCPSRTGSNVLPATVARLSELRNIVALKDAADDVEYTSEVVTSCDITVLSGADSKNFPILALGGRGVISVLANIAPRATADMCEAALAGDMARALAVHKKYYRLSNAIFLEGNPVSIKAGVEMMGLIGPEVRAPLVPMTDAGRTKLRVAMEEVGLL